MGSEELVAVYDAAGNEVGAAPRSRVRAEGLWHAASSVLVRSVDGQRVYVHLRSAQKDVFASTYDCWARGVMDPSETAEQCARRELAEELGIHDVPLTPLFGFRHEDGSLHCHNTMFEARWDGPVVHQPEEVADGGWLTLAELRALLADPSRPFAPDGRIGIERWLAEQD